jgi:hypothetical protein
VYRGSKGGFNLFETSTDSHLYRRGKGARANAPISVTRRRIGPEWTSSPQTTLCFDPVDALLHAHKIPGPSLAADRGGVRGTASGSRYVSSRSRLSLPAAPTPVIIVFSIRQH